MYFIVVTTVSVKTFAFGVGGGEVGVRRCFATMPDALRENTMTQRFYAQDTCFYSSMGTYSFEDRCEMTKAVGFDATYLSICDGRNWATVQQLNSVKDALRH